MNQIDDTIDEYETAASIRETDFSQLGIDDFANVEIDSDGNAYGIVMDVPIKINDQLKKAEAPAPAAETPPPAEDDAPFGQFLGDLNVALDAPFSGITQGVAKFLGNTAGALGIFEQKEVDKFFKAVDGMNKTAVKDNPAANVLGTVGALGGQYILPALTGFNALRALGASKLLSSIVSESMVGLLGLSPNDENLFNMIAKDTSSPAAAAVRDLLATDPDDSEWTNRVKNAGEALVLLGGSEALIRGLPKLVQQGKEFIKSDKGQEVVRSVEDMGARADERLGSMMDGTTLSANPINAVGDMALSAAGKMAGRAGGEQVATDLDPQGFFSAVSRAVDTIPMDKGSGAQMRAMIAKGEGVKAEEMAWTGLDDFLAGKKSVTKQEVRAYVDANQVQIEEVVLPAKKDLTAESTENYRNNLEEMSDEQLAKESADEFGIDENDALDAIIDGDREAYIDDLMVEYERFLGQGGGLDVRSTGVAKFGEYTLPGGENYREVLLKLPAKTGAETNAARYDELNQIAARRNLTDAESDEMVAIEQAEFSGTSGTAGDDFVSGHFDEKNVLAHIRLNDRTGPNGERILFIEEIQSDWHQKGRKQGYKTSEITKDNAGIDGQVADLEKRRTDITVDLRENFNVGGTATPDGNGVRWYSLDIMENNDYKNIGQVNQNGSYYTNLEFAETNPLVAQKLKELAEIATEVGNLNRSKRTGSMVPDAPLKKNWHEMSFRRVARMAAEEGYDAISWTPGKVQAERYDLSKQLDAVRIKKIRGGEKDGQYLVRGRKGASTEPFFTKAVSEKELPDLIGKDLAEKAVKEAPEYDDGIEYTGVDLQVGGEGMKGFYDKMLKKYAEKWGKKFGSKVGVTDLKGAAKNITDNEIEVISEVGNTWVGKLEDGGTITVSMDDFPDVADASAEMIRIKASQDNATGTQVWTMPVTKKMRDSVLKKGVPLFSAAGAAAATGAAMQENDKQI